MQDNKAKRIANTIIEELGHRKGLPFSNELLSWLRNADLINNIRPYHFLTDKYVHYTLEAASGGIILTTSSQKPDIINQVQELNEYLTGHSR